MTTEVKALLGIGVVTLLIIVGAIFLLGVPSNSTQQTPQKVTDTALLYGSHPQTMGNKNAKVTIVEFADFQCPACGAAYPIVHQIQGEYKDKIYYIFRNFPLPMHANARVAANAAEAAGAQGKFWEMHNKLYENQETWSDSKDPLNEYFMQYAKDLNLNLDQFKKDVESKKYEDWIKADESAAMQLGVNSTPTFYINGVKEAGVLGYDTFKQKIDAAMK